MNAEQSGMVTKKTERRGEFKERLKLNACGGILKIRKGV